MKNDNSSATFTKHHGNKGNSNAKKKTLASCQMQIRISESEKAIFVAQAKEQKMTLSAWVLKILNDYVLTKQK